MGIEILLATGSEASGIPSASTTHEPKTPSQLATSPQPRVFWESVARSDNMGTSRSPVSTWLGTKVHLISLRSHVVPLQQGHGDMNLANI